MTDKDTIIVVGITRLDEYGNLWVTPSGGGEEVKIAEKRSSLHPLFEQGKAVMLHWEIYKNKPYVSDAKSVEGELPTTTPTPPFPKDQQPPVTKEKADPTRKSIERQTALKVAGEIAVAKINQGKEMDTGKIIAVATIFESYLENGATVKDKEP